MMMSTPIKGNAIFINFLCAWPYSITKSGMLHCSCVTMILIHWAILLNSSILLMIKNILVVYDEGEKGRKKPFNVFL